MGISQSLSRTCYRTAWVFSKNGSLAKYNALKAASKERGIRDGKQDTAASNIKVIARAGKRMPPLVWIDVETTGLVVEKDLILEIAMLITDSDLNQLAPAQNIVIGHASEELKKLNAWSLEWHSRSGLLREVSTSKVTIKEAEQTLLALIVKHCPVPNKAILAGNNVAFDRKFLESYMPILANYIHFRNVDVSTLNELAKRWAPDILRGYSKKHTHRALDDITESLHELQYYKSSIFSNIEQKDL
ncbi:ribonuclease H-like domain-containing protein [Coemansia spiralis]|nr:ribonuclease H-like domain-containing protein [Coemansia spiralis]